MLFNYFFLNEKYKVSRLKKNLDLKEDCVVMGNGPGLFSFIQNSFSFFSDKDIYAVNDFSLSPSFDVVKPNFYVIIDPAYWFPDRLNLQKKKCLENILNVTWKINLIFPIDAKSNCHKIFCNHEFISVYYFSNIAIGNINNLFFLNRFGLFNPYLQNVLAYALFLSLNNKSKNIYLVGAEHSWLKNLIVDDHNIVCASIEYFYEEKKAHEPFLTWYGENYKLHDLLFDFGKTFRTYHELFVYSKSLNSNVFNISKDSYIDAFDKSKIGLYEK